MTDIRLTGVRARRSGRDVLSIASLHVPSGRTTAILGPNGAGKTTLLRLVAGLDRPHAGRVLVGGEVADTRRRCVSYVFQEDVFLRRTVVENVMLGLRVRGVSRADARTRALAALGLLGIEALAARRADQISGGERRRASLARALCLGAPVLLLDEPMAGLDGGAYTRLLDELPGLLRAAGATTVVVSHDREEAFRLCDDVAVLVDGEVRATGTKEEVATNPRRRDVAEVLGYTVLSLAGGTIAVPDGALVVADNGTGLTATIEGVLDLVQAWDLTATIGSTRVHLRLPRSSIPPQPGTRVSVAALETYAVS